MAARVGDERTHARGYLALQFALTTAGRYPEALEAAQQARWRLEALGAEHALRTLDMQLALTYVHVRNFDAALEHAQRLLRGLSPGERWLRGNAHALSALAYYQQPGRQAECASAASAALRETQEIGNLVGEAYSLEVFAWLAADAGRCQRAAWLLGAAQGLWERTGGRLSGSAVLEGHHQRSAATAASALGAARYAELHAAGADQAARADRRAGRRRRRRAARAARIPGRRTRIRRLGRAARGSPPASGRSPCSSRAGCPTGRSPRGSSSPSGPWTRTSITSSPSSGSPRGCS